MTTLTIIAIATAKAGMEEPLLQWRHAWLIFALNAAGRHVLFELGRGDVSSRALLYRWVNQKREFIEERAKAARIVRDETIKPREAVQKHAELAARGLRDSEDQGRFVAQVRRALADDIERGEPLT